MRPRHALTLFTCTSALAFAPLGAHADDDPTLRRWATATAAPEASALAARLSAVPVAPPAPPPPRAASESPGWFQRLQLRGYTQIRYNRLPSLRPNDQLVNAQGDRSIGGGNGLLIRRARLVLFGDVHDRVSIYLQPDFASVMGEQFHVAILRDWYADISLDRAKELRIRVGQSKVPYGFENLQSSQNRLPIDRNDALNSAVRDERDLGLFLYWAPSEMRARFRHLVSSGLKGSGDYGVVGIGVFNGQTANQPARVDNLHVIGRVSVPFLVGDQFFEIGGGGYHGKYQIKTLDQPTMSYTVAGGSPLLLDARAFGSFVMYPQPLGLVVEYTLGVGPQQGRDDPSVIDARFLQGGYAQLMLKLDGPFGSAAMIPYARGTYYDGGKKFMTNAPRYLVRELEVGVEWQVIPALELVGAYQLSDRSSDVFPHRQEAGHVTRVQVQFNY